MFAIATRILGFVILACAPAAFAQSLSQPVEPKAGSWKTWVISSGKDFRVPPPPPDAAATLEELAWLKSFSQDKDPRIDEQVRFWNAGPPSYRWVDVVTNRMLDPTTLRSPPGTPSTLSTGSGQANLTRESRPG